ncbi:MAG: IS30 family transposase, partial [Candidatus Marinimicrobia bacterium]|nr:IS30 family transposase [Candidatus Neomarinimicrobiota bacterium]NQU68302.1 IS30 family transposase [Candidatus Neomarinimicrobiota bacterium]
IIRAINRLNNRPRKCLGFKTPYQVFFEEVSIVALNT